MNRFLRPGQKILLLLFAVSVVLPLRAQIDDKYQDYREVMRDTTALVEGHMTIVRDTLLDPFRIVTNHFGYNWFLTGSGGVHSFRGDYSKLGPFKGTLSPEWSIGVGKWLTPWVGLKLDGILSDSRGYTPYKTGDYGYKDVEGKDYRLMKTRWADVGLSAMINLTRLFTGYEGWNSRKNMNQFMLNFGVGAVHHLGNKVAYGSQNELSAHTELQYSRFFTPERVVSLDVKVRGLLYQTNFDGEYGQLDHAAQLVDANVGVHIGLTFYLGNRAHRSWNRVMTTVYRDKWTEHEIKVLKVKEEEEKAVVVIEQEKPVHSGTLTFFVFYPNNYSGRNDAPLIPTSTVNALDYLAGGIFTQKRYADTELVASRIRDGQSLKGLKIVDLPTEKADQDFVINYVPRGYEMLEGTPISLSLDYDAMNEFCEKAGYYYAPIFDGMNVWKYRIDDVALGQHLVSSANYQETNSYGLNTHAGLETVSRYMDIAEEDELVSFADVYAALNKDEGYISNFTDEEAVARVRKIFEKGVVGIIQVEGLATSQGAEPGAEFDERNAALAENRAQTVISWLTGYEALKDTRSQIMLMNSRDGIRTVNDPSTRGLNAKLNRCVKVRIRYLIQE